MRLGVKCFRRVRVWGACETLDCHFKPAHPLLWCACFPTSIVVKEESGFEGRTEVLGMFMNTAHLLSLASSFDSNTGKSSTKKGLGVARSYGLVLGSGAEDLSSIWFVSLQ